LIQEIVAVGGFLFGRKWAWGQKILRFGRLPDGDEGLNKALSLIIFTGIIGRWDKQSIEQ
jgi:hypothetical protein